MLVSDLIHGSERARGCNTILLAMSKSLQQLKIKKVKQISDKFPPCSITVCMKYTLRFSSDLQLENGFDWIIFIHKDFSYCEQASKTMTLGIYWKWSLLIVLKVITIRYELSYKRTLLPYSMLTKIYGG